MNALPCGRALGAGMAIAMVAACGGPEPPVVAPIGAMPQASAKRIHAEHSNPWTLKVLHVFKGYPDDGAGPVGSLFALGNELYGATNAGGAEFAGTVFEINASGKERVLHSFNGKHRGLDPGAGPIGARGILYGTTYLGGKRDRGMIYELSTSGLERVLYNFKGDGGDGSGPNASLVLMNGVLYGTTSSGGTLICGTVFSFDLASGKESVLYQFRCGSDGEGPDGLIRVGGKLYGVTLYGGTGCVPDGCGTVFEIDTSGQKRTLYRFKGGTDGTTPLTVIDVSGRLYGTTWRGGASYCSNGTMIVGCGTIFEIDASGKKRTVHNFKGSPDGAFPSDLIGVGDTLYGTTSEGGTSNLGTIFQAEPSGKETALLSFGYSDDSEGPTSLIADKGGFYGTTVAGGDSYCYITSYDLGTCGTVFAVNKSTEP
jgi:uncharacterized repeat protein (TIGR03803 family)